MNPHIISLLHVPADSLGGLQRTAADLDRALRGAGFDVTSLSPDTFLKLRPEPVDRLFGYLFQWRKSAELIRQGDWWESCIVIAHNGAGWGYRDLPVMRIWQNEAGDYADRAYSKWHPNRWKLRTLDCRIQHSAGRDSRNFAVSTSTARHLEENSGLTVHQVIENGVDLKHFRPLGEEEGNAFRAQHGLPARPRKLLLFAGRPENYKGLPLLVEWAKLLERELDIMLAGMDKVPAAFAGCRNVHAVGRIGYDDMPRLYAAADFFALPSLHEGCSYGVMEAMACGVPSLLTAAGHVESIASRNRSLAPWIAPIGRREQLTGHLVNWLHDAELAQAVGRMMRDEAVRSSSLERFNAQWVAAVRDFIEVRP